MKKLTASLFALVLIASTVFMACEQGEKTIVLRYKYTQGLKLVYHQDMQRNARVSVGDSVIEKSSNKFTVSVTQIVEEVRPDSTAVIRETDKWSYTRPSKADSTVLDTVSSVRTMLVTVRPDGDILDVQFVDDMNETNRTYIKNFMEQGMPVFPSGEISPGFSWTQTAKVIMPDQTMEAKSTYKLTALVREAGYDCALIEVDGNLVIPIAPSPKDTIKTSGVERIRTTGKMYFAYKEGMVVLQRERWVIEGDHKVERVSGTKASKLQVESDVDYALVERTVEQ